MHEEFRHNLRKLMEFNTFRGGFGKNEDMPVHGVDYNEQFHETDDGPDQELEVSPDDQQNDVILLKHHAEDALEALNSSELDVATASLHDILEITEKMTSELPDDLQAGVGKVEECGMCEPDSQENDRFPVGSADPHKDYVSTGETTPFGMERSDDVDYVGRDDTKAEIASLLVTIGHILQKDRLVPNKFEMPMIMEYLNRTFTNQKPEDMQHMYESFNKGQ